MVSGGQVRWLAAKLRRLHRENPPHDAVAFSVEFVLVHPLKTMSFSHLRPLGFAGMGGISILSCFGGAGRSRIALSGRVCFIAPLSPSAASVVQVQTTPAPVHVDTNGLPLAQGVVPGATVALFVWSEMLRQRRHPCVAPEVAAGPLAVSMVTEHRTFVGLPQSRRPAAQERAAGLVREYRRAVRKPRIPRVDSSTSVPVPERTPSHSPMAPVPATPSRLGRFVDAVLSPFKG
ncbi:uncharacterized protein ATNIH1004_008042 [Aspergillus tanneri]|uniref:Uncharacterized protein n=1 Tax=Aspergillus tanneri TaxID=1220188 RepID=A0A5M9MPY6_9EURO|nr:uncharacterized protein ATNIH1004_008042 [Aspergillus tanneri]KAA8646609.1 hypothetical protein ATNIH1004_008042 [Aspergillus tanneri]